MPRITLPSPETMDPDQRRVYDKIVSGPRGKIQGPLRAALHNAELAERWSALGALLRYRTTLHAAPVGTRDPRHRPRLPLAVRVVCAPARGREGRHRGAE